MTNKKFSTWISLIGCRKHNLKNISLRLPKNALTVLTGVSGSGKSSLAFDTLFAEGQRRYLEYLSPQIRSLVKQMPKPQVDIIEGLSPTLAVSQAYHTLSAQGTIATYTDIYDFLSLLYAKIGEQHSPATGKRLIRYSRQEMIVKILADYPLGTRIQLLAPIKLHAESITQAINRLQQMGFVRLKIEGKEWTSEDPLPSFNSNPSLEVIVDRLEIKGDIRERLAGSVETALDLSQGILKVQEGKTGPLAYFSEIYVCPETGLSFAPLEPIDFNFNSLRGACPVCQGKGGQERINAHLVVENSSLHLAEFISLLLNHLPKKIAASFSTALQVFLKEWPAMEAQLMTRLPKRFLKAFLEGSDQEMAWTTWIGGKAQLVKTTWQGLIPFLDHLLEHKKTAGSLNTLAFVEWQPCPVCQGARLKPESLACLIQGKNIDTLCRLTVDQFVQEIQSWSFTGKAELVLAEILPSIYARLHFLQQVGLGYLELNRQGKTLSDGEAQRIRLAAQIGAKLTGLTYVLDEPSLGLHRQDIHYLQQALVEIKALGNTIVMVEHERHLIGQADHIVEMGPGAGREGGYLTFQGTYAELLADSNSLTGQWLSSKRKFPTPPRRKAPHEWLQVQKASLHNLKDFNIKIPLGCFVGFCGVSGSGKSTLVLDLIGVPLKQALTQGTIPLFLKGYASIQRVILSQKQAERFSARSIPATYVSLMTPLRQLFAETRLAKARGYSAARFSLNKRGGRCETCEGLGQIRVNMQIMPDLFVPCEVCQGQRYNYETLQVTWENRTIADILALSIEEAAAIFRPIPTLYPTLMLMNELGLGYLTLGQPFTTLSSGEIQRLRLVADLATKTQVPTLYLLDEPSAGLHFEDIQKLVLILHRLVDQGHSIFMIEHHLDLLRQADWLIELGPGGGPQGGKLIFEGTAAKLAKADTPTGVLLK